MTHSLSLNQTYHTHECHCFLIFQTFFSQFERVDNFVSTAGAPLDTESALKIKPCMFVMKYVYPWQISGWLFHCFKINSFLTVAFIKLCPFHVRPLKYIYMNRKSLLIKCRTHGRNVMKWWNLLFWEFYYFRAWEVSEWEFQGCEFLGNTRFYLTCCLIFEVLG